LLNDSLSGKQYLSPKKAYWQGFYTSQITLFANQYQYLFGLLNHKSLNCKITLKIMTAEELSKLIVKGMEEKKASDIVVMDLRGIKNSFTDFFVICSGNSDTQIEAISDSIEEMTLKLKEKPWRSEGKDNKQWILIDYINVVAHVFLKEKRDFYGLEELWGDAKITRI